MILFVVLLIACFLGSGGVFAVHLIHQQQKQTSLQGKIQKKNSQQLKKDIVSAPEKEEIPNEEVSKSDENPSSNTETKTSSSTILPKQEEASSSPQTTPPSITSPPVEPQCTPKKFDFSFVRADFSTFDACKATGDLYRQAGWGYFCDNYQDDCGDTYYMLTLYEANTGTQYDYHQVPLP